MVKALGIAILLAALLLLPDMLVPRLAVAQEFNQIQVIVQPRLNIERARKLRHTVNKAIDQHVRSPNSIDVFRFGADLLPEAVEPADEVLPSPTNWNLWFEGSHGEIESSEPLRGYDADQQSHSIGLDVALGDRLILGGIANYSDTDIEETILPGTSTTESWSGGPYVALFLADTVVLTGSLLYGRADNRSTSAGVTAEYGSESWDASAQLTSYFFADAWTFKPSVGGTYSHERDDAYLDSAANPFAETTTETATLTFGGEVVYTFAGANGSLFEPYVGIEAEWVVLNSVMPTGGFITDDRVFDAIVTAGADLQWNDNLAFSVSASFAGLAQRDYRSVTGTARLTLSF